MRHHQTIDENQKALRRIVAVLLALAGLLDRAAGRSRGVCRLVVWLLRPGEVVARDYLDRLAPGAARLAAPEPLRLGATESCYGAAEALRLAASFRALAAALAAFVDDCCAVWQAAPASRLCAGLIALSAPATRSTYAAAVGRFDSS
ncbi:MAG: hypothetical protein ABIK36_20595 [Pseudomonadota bacterium]